jgi:hypothetical protein
MWEEMIFRANVSNVFCGVTEPANVFYNLNSRAATAVLFKIKTTLKQTLTTKPKTRRAYFESWIVQTRTDKTQGDRIRAKKGD